MGGVLSMDLDKTRPFELGPPDSPDACLLIHGFTGSPWEMRPLGEALAARGLRVKGIRLPGHGGEPEAMAGVSARDWEEACETALDAFASTPRVFVAGLSMGALLALLLAARRPERVHGVALLAPAVQFRGPTMRLLYLVRNTPFLEIVRPWVNKDSTDIADPVSLAQAPVMRRFPSARIHDLYAVRDRALENLRNVVAPVLIACARHDHVVSKDGGIQLQRGLIASPSVKYVEVDEGSHIMPRDYGKDVLFAEVGAFFDSLRQ